MSGIRGGAVRIRSLALRGGGKRSIVDLGIDPREWPPAIIGRTVTSRKSVGNPQNLASYRDACRRIIATTMSKTIPRYALAPIVDCRDYWIDALRLLRISSQGIDELIALPDLMEALGYSGKPSLGRKRTPEQIEKEHATWQEAKETSLFAKKEVDSQFPLLHAHT